MCMSILYQIQIFHPITISSIANSRLASPCLFSGHLLLFPSLILLTHCISVVAPQIFPVFPQWLLFPFVRCPFTSYGHTFLRFWLLVPLPSLPHLVSVLQPCASPLFFHPSPICRTCRTAKNGHCRRKWWCVLGAGSGCSLERKALPKLEVENSFWWEWEAQGLPGEEERKYTKFCCSP